MAEIITMGELLVEIMRPHEDIPFYETGLFRGPFPSGAPGIFISTVARMGHSAAIIGGVGADDFGENILERLRRDGVDISNVLVSAEGHTGIAFVTYFADGERKFIFYTQGSPALMAKAPLSTEDFKDTKYMHVMGCSLMSNENFGHEILKTMYMLKEKGVKVSFDPNVRAELMKDSKCIYTLQEVLNQSFIVMPGVSELKILTGENQIEKAIAKAFKSKELEVLVLKNGSKGSEVYTRDGLIVKQNVYKVIQEDPTGAGDCFDAAFLCGIAEGKSLEDASKMAAAAGALNAAAFGPMEGNISPETIEKMIKGA